MKYLSMKEWLIVLQRSLQLRANEAIFLVLIATLLFSAVYIVFFLQFKEFE